ncbi:MAG TPA: ABC transporter permease [Longimicrobiales bacterium]
MRHHWALMVREVALGLLPRDFRSRYRGEMGAAFEELHRDATHRGVGAVTGVLLRELTDLVAAAARLRLAGGRTQLTGGGPGRDTRRTGGGGEIMANVLRAIRLSARTLLRKPGFTLVAVTTIAVGVGGATAMFALVERVLLRPLPYPEPDRLVHVFLTNPELGWERGPVSFPNFHDWRVRAREADLGFRTLSAYQLGVRRTLTGSGDTRQIQGTRVTGELFETLGVPARHGRTLNPGDEGPGAEPVIVLSHGLWQREYGGDPSVVGTRIDVGDERPTVVGVMPGDFPSLYRDEEFWVPFPFAPEQLERDQSFLTVVGRLEPGVEVERARASMEALVREMESVRPEGLEGRSTHVETRARVVTGHVETQLLLLLGAVSFLLVIAAANLAGLMLARGASRKGEMAVRTAMGARRGHLVRELFTESLVIAVVGGALAFPLARVLLDLVLTLGPVNLPRRSEVVLDPVAGLFAVAVTLVSAVAFGLLPALQVSRRGPGRDLRLGGRDAGARGGASPLQRALVVAQVAIAVVLLTGAGLLSGSLLRLQAESTGFDGSGVLTFRLHPPQGQYENADELAAVYEEFLDGLRALPGVHAAGGTWALPFGESFGSSTYMVEGRPDDEAYLLQLVPLRGDYLEAMDIPVLKGRAFGPEDHSAGAPLRVIVNRGLAERVWPGGDAVGKRLRRGSGDEALFMEVVGVVPDVTMMAVGEEPLMQAFWPHGAVPWARELYFAVRTNQDPATLIGPARTLARRLDARMPMTDVATMDERLAEQLAGPRFRTWLVAGFAVTAALLALLGLYGVTAFVVARRSHEIGVRMALGARRSRILVRVLAEGSLLAAIGATVGLVAAAALSRTVESLLYRTQPVDPAIYGAVVAGVLVATLAACWLPARRASAVDPVEALRSE